MTDDAEMVARALAGGPEAFEPIVRRYGDAVFGVALARLGDFHDAEDAAQNAFLEAYGRLGNLRDPARLGSWLRSIAIHRSIDHLRARRRVADAEVAQRRADPMASPKEEIERRELRDQVLAAVARLSQAQRETVALYYINGYSQKDVAAIQKVPLGSVKRRLHDARRRLQKDMLHMVEDVLKSEGPTEDFAQRVFEVLSCRRPHDGPKMRWPEIVAELKRIGSRGAEGYAKALECRHSPTRVAAAGFCLTCEAPDTKELVVALLTKALHDPNKKVRRNAVDAILRVDVSAERRREELLPLVLERLADRSARVRRRVAYVLGRDAAGDVPWQAAAEAATKERDPKTQDAVRELLRAVLRANQARSP